MEPDAIARNHSPEAAMAAFLSSGSVCVSNSGAHGRSTTAAQQADALWSSGHVITTGHLGRGRAWPGVSRPPFPARIATGGGVQGNGLPVLLPKPLPLPTAHLPSPGELASNKALPLPYVGA